MKKLLMLGMLLSSLSFASWILDEFEIHSGTDHRSFANIDRRSFSDIQNSYKIIISKISCSDTKGIFHLEFNSLIPSTLILYKYPTFNEKFDEKEIEFKVDQNDVIKIYGKFNPSSNYIYIKGYTDDNKEKIILSFTQLINEMKEGKELKINVRIDGVDETLVFPLDNFKNVFEEGKFILY